MSQQINLFNPVFLKQKKYFSAVTMAQALGLILAGSAMLAAYANYQSFALNKDAVTTASQLAEAQAQLAKIEATSTVRQKSKTIEEEVRKTEAEVKSLQQVFDTLQKGDLGNTKGYSDYFRAFSRQIASGLWLTGLNISGAGNEIGIQGRALRPQLVPEYLGRLRREATMQGKSFAILEMQMPKIEQNAAANQAASKPQLTIDYIEFNLQSSGLAKDKPDAAGAQGK